MEGTMETASLRKLTGVVLTALSVVALLVGCAAEAPPNPDVRGNVTSVTGVGRSDGDNLCTVLVEGSVQKDTRVDRASVTVTRDTKIYAWEEGHLVTTTFDALKVGETVEAWFTGPVRESYPVQATAREIIIQ
jgi:hypothetical protein